MTINSSSVVSEGIDMTVSCDKKMDESPRVKDKVFFEEQKEFLDKCLNEKLTIGDSWFLIDKDWYRHLEKYIEAGVGGDDPENENPGPIDNSPLCQLGSSKLKEHLMEGGHYKLINEEGWNELVNSFGIINGQEPLKRSVIDDGLYNKETKVEIYPPHLKLCLFNSLENIIDKDISKSTTLENVVKLMKELLELPEDEEVRLWSRFMQNTYELLVLTETKSLQDQGINSGQTLVLEQKK